MYSLRNISIKTQVRRLRYFYIILKFLQHGIPKSILARKVIVWSTEAHSDFLDFSYSTGEIVKSKKNLRNSQSFENYFNASKSLGLLIEQHGMVIPTRMGEILTKFYEIESLIDKNPNIYCLTDIERFFFAYNIFLRDFDIIFVILSMLRNNQLELSFYLENFREAYLDRLENKMDNISLYHRDKVYDTYSRVLKWRSHKRYSEDIVSSRINWLLDLGIVDEEKLINEGKYTLSKESQILIENIPVISKTGFKDIDSNWFFDDFFKYFNSNNTSELFYWKSLSTEKQDEIITQSLDIFMHRFNTIGFPRLSVEQTTLFISLYSIYKFKVIIELNEILSWIGFKKAIGNYKLGYRKASRPGETYLAIYNE